MHQIFDEVISNLCVLLYYGTLDFFIIVVADILSHIMIVGEDPLCCISIKILFNQIVSHVVFVVAMYFASIEGNATVFCFFDNQESCFVPKKKKKELV